MVYILMSPFLCVKHLAQDIEEIMAEELKA